MNFLPSGFALQKTRGNVKRMEALSVKRAYRDSRRKARRDNEKARGGAQRRGGAGHFHHTSVVTEVKVVDNSRTQQLLPFKS